MPFYRKIPIIKHRNIALEKNNFTDPNDITGLRERLVIAVKTTK